MEGYKTHFDTMHGTHGWKTLLIIFLLVIIGIFVLSAKTNNSKPSVTPDPTLTITPKFTPAHTTTNGNKDIIVLSAPAPEAVVTAPLILTGRARGPWFFEASFPIMLTDWDGRIIAQHYATAQGEWMTQDFVPFESKLEFESPYKKGDPDFMKRGTLILQKDNPSGLPEHDDALEITIWFAE